VNTMQKNNAIFIALIMLVVGAAGGFFAGTYYQKSQRVTFSGGMGNGVGNQMMRQEGGQRVGYNNGTQAMGFRPVTGEITSADDKSITVKMQDGSSKIVVFSDKTSVNKADTASTKDLKTGEKVMVVGKENADGSVTAQNIQLNPIMRMMEKSNSQKPQ
jgi:Domain of unknown function (DUF5666)